MNTNDGYTIFAGTTSMSLWSSNDSGKTWRTLWGPGLPFGSVSPWEGQVRAIHVDPTNSKVIYAGDEIGVLKSEDGGKSFKRLNGAVDGQCIWSVAVDPIDPNIVFAGSREADVFRSKDGGKTWQKLNTGMPKTCMIGVPRVTRLGVDPTDHRHVWAVVEAGGPWRSFDGGDTWQQVWGGLVNEHKHQDMHSLSILPGTELSPSGHENFVTLGRGRKTTVVFTSVSGVFATDDNGETVRPIITEDTAPMRYFQIAAVRPDDPQTIFVGIGDSLPGSIGAIVKTTNGGKTWEKMDLPVLPNSELHNIVINPGNPEQVVATSIFGQIYKSDDGGHRWEKLSRELSEIRMLAVVPN